MTSFDERCSETKVVFVVAVLSIVGLLMTLPGVSFADMPGAGASHRERSVSEFLAGNCANIRLNIFNHFQSGFDAVKSYNIGFRETSLSLAGLLSTLTINKEDKSITYRKTGNFDSSIKPFFCGGINYLEVYNDLAAARENAGLPKPDIIENVDTVWEYGINCSLSRRLSMDMLYSELRELYNVKDTSGEHLMLKVNYLW